MIVAGRFELPEELRPKMRQAVRLEWVTLAYLVSVVILMYLVMGSSQAMKTAWVEDLLSLIPPVAFLIATRIRRREPNVEYPYGYHRAVNIAFLFAAMALLTMGFYLLGDAAVKLITAEHPSIGSVHAVGHTVWLGWLMLPVLIWSVVPVVVLGRMKVPLAKELHDKTLFADAQMNKADWLTGGGAMLGVVGIGVGWWWMDALAAGLISLDIVKDGFQNMRSVIGDLMDRRPETVDHSKPSTVPERLKKAVESLDWVRSAEVRLREEGHVFFGEVSVVPQADTIRTSAPAEIQKLASGVDWRLFDLVVQIASDSSDQTGLLKSPAKEQRHGE